MPSGARATLDDPELQSRLRYKQRSSTYFKRPLQHHYSNKLDIIVRPPATKQQTATQNTYPTDSAIQPVAASRIFEPPNDQQNSKPKGYKKLAAKLSMPFFLNIATLKKAFQKAGVLYGAAGLLLVFGVYVGVNGWMANDQVATQVQHLQKAANNISSGSNKDDKKRNGPTVPSTEPVSKYSMANYKVAPDLARYIKIPKIQVYSRVLQVGVTDDGHMDVPSNIYDTAWYNGSNKPGKPGATLIDGHLDGYNAAGVFWNLHKLVKGDTIKIERGDGEVLTYKVVKSKTYNTGNVDMESAMVPVVEGKSGLNLTTCAGDYSLDGGYTKRLIVYATQV